MSRKNQAIAIIMSGTMLVAVVGCGGTTTTGTANNSVAPATSSQNGTTKWQGDTINVLSWEGYQENQWVKPFEQKYGVKVNVTYVGSVEEMFSKVLSGSTKYDMAFVDGGTIPRYYQHNLLLPIDVAHMSNTSGIIPLLNQKDQKYVNFSGQSYGVPFAWGAMPIAVNTKFIKDPIDSWAALWNPKYMGHIEEMDDTNNEFPMAALYLHEPDPFNLTSSQMNDVKQAFLKQKPLVLTYSPSQETTERLFADGSAWIGYVEGTNVIGDLDKKGYPIKEVIPKEGAPVWVDHCVILKTSPHPDLVATYVDYLLSPKVQSELATVTSYGVANGNVNKILSPQQLAAVHMDDPNFWAHLIYMAPPNNFEQRVQIWNSVKTGQ